MIKPVVDNGLNHTVTKQVGDHQSSPYLAKRDIVELGFPSSLGFPFPQAV